MNRKMLQMIVLALLLVFTGSVPATIVTAMPAMQESSTAESDASDQDDADEEEEGLELTTAALSSTLVQPGRSIVHARGNHFVVDSVPPLGGPNEERNPLDLLLGSLATCGLFIFESGAIELDMPLESLSVAVEGDLAVKGLKDGSVNPRVRAFRVMIDAQGISDEDFEVLHERWKIRCPIYTTLIRSAPIEVIRVGTEIADSTLDSSTDNNSQADTSGEDVDVLEEEKETETESEDNQD